MSNMKLVESFRVPSILFFVCLALFIGQAFLTPASSFAQEEPKGNVSIDAAKDYFIRGSNAFDSGNFKKAADDFLKSYELSANPILLYNIAKAYQASGDLPEALNFFKRYLDSVPDAPNKSEVNDLLKKIDADLAKRSGVLDIRSQDDGSYTVRLDDPKNGQSCVTPCTLNVVGYGSHTFYVFSEIGETSTYIRFIDGSRQEPLLVGVASGTTSGGVGGIGAVKLIMDDVSHVTDLTLGKTRYSKKEGTLFAGTSNIKLDSGTYDLSINHKDIVWTAKVDVQGNRQTEVLLSLRQLDSVKSVKSSWKWVTGWIATGAGLGSLIGAGLVHFLHSDLDKTIAYYYNDLSEVSLNQFQRRKRLISSGMTALYGTGGALLATGVVLLLWDAFGSKGSVDSGIVFKP